MNSENGFRIIIVIDKFINPSHGSGVASWAVDLRDEFKKQGIWCEVAGYYEGSSQFDINAKEDMQGDTLLHYAVLFRNYEIIKLLLDAGVDTTIVNNQGKTAEQYATTPEMMALFNK